MEKNITLLEPIIDNRQLQLSKIQLDEAYCKEWNITSNDFYLLCKNNKPISYTLYRKIFLSEPNLEKDKYFILLKHTECLYSKDFIKKIYSLLTDKDLETKRKYLKTNYVILDSEGNEKFVTKDKECYSPYLVKNSCIFSINSYYYNIEDNYFYGYSTNTIETKNYLILKLINKSCVLQINKKTGKFKIIN